MDKNHVLTNALFRKKMAELTGEDIAQTPHFNDFQALDGSTFKTEMDKVIANPPWSGGGSGGGEAYEVHVTEDSETYTMDKTVAEMWTAYSSGKQVVLVYEDGEVRKYPILKFEYGESSKDKTFYAVCVEDVDDKEGMYCSAFEYNGEDDELYFREDITLPSVQAVGDMIEEASSSICYLYVDPTDYTNEGEPIYTNAVIKDSDDNTLTAYDIYHIYKETTENIIVISNILPPDGPEMHVYYPLIQEMSMNVPGLSSVYRYFIFGFTMPEPGKSGYVGQTIIAQSAFDGVTGDEIAAAVIVSTINVPKAFVGTTSASINTQSGQFVVAPVTSEDSSRAFTLNYIEQAYTANTDVYVKVTLTDDGNGGTAGQAVNRKIKFNLSMIDEINAAAIFEASILEQGGVTHLQLEGIDNGGSLVWSMSQKSLS